MKYPLLGKSINTNTYTVFWNSFRNFCKIFKYTASNTLPFIFEYLDISNFLGRFCYMVIDCFVIYSHSSIRASLNVLVFFIGMVSSYYLYSYFLLLDFFQKIMLCHLVLLPFLHC